MRRILFFVFLPFLLHANPSGESVSYGSVSFVRPEEGMLDVLQTSEKAIVEWQDFSIDEQELTRFIQPGKNAVLLNKVLGPNLSEIYGKLEGNGQIFLVNPHGVLVGATGVVDCASVLFAAFHLDDKNFLEGHDFVFKNGGDSSVVNKGIIRSHDGPLFLIGPDVENEGQLIGSTSEACMISGDEILLSSLDHPKVMIRPALSSKKDLNHNAYALAINTTERVEATGVEKKNGRVFLVGGVSRAIPFFSFDHTEDPLNELPKVEAAVDALIQLQSLIPERIWEQEFSILVARDAFFRSLHCMNLKCAEKTMRPRFGIGHSHRYFLKSTMSGDPSRITDYYEEFQFSPFWRSPAMLSWLIELETREMQQ